MTYTLERTNANADVNPSFAETENPAAVSYAVLNADAAKFSLLGAFVETKAAVVEAASVVAATVELVTAAEVEELASATAVDVAAAAAVVVDIVVDVPVGQQISSAFFI
jgi:hypothetical protein